MPAQVLAILFPIQLPANVPPKALDDSPITRASTIHVAYEEEVSGCWLPLSPDPALAVILGNETEIEWKVLSLCLLNIFVKMHTQFQHENVLKPNQSKKLFVSFSP